MMAHFRRMDDVRSFLFQRLGNEPTPDSVTAAHSRIRPELDCLYEELRRRLGSTLSGTHLIRRFKARCEAFEARRLRRAARASSRHEAPLEAELARWLFDQGLNPITQTSVANLRPDVVDPFLARPVFAEAKQYATRLQVQRARFWVSQVCDTIARLRGTPFQVSEAFLVVFRRGGPALAIDEPSIVVGGETIHVVVIDIAESRVSGSRQRQAPVRLSLREATGGADRPESPGR